MNLISKIGITVVSAAVVIGVEAKTMEETQIIAEKTVERIDSIEDEKTRKVVTVLEAAKMFCIGAYHGFRNGLVITAAITPAVMAWLPEESSEATE